MLPVERPPLCVEPLDTEDFVALFASVGASANTGTAWIRTAPHSTMRFNMTMYLLITTCLQPIVRRVGESPQGADLQSHTLTAAGHCIGIGYSRHLPPISAS